MFPSSSSRRRNELRSSQVDLKRKPWGCQVLLNCISRRVFRSTFREVSLLFLLVFLISVIVILLFHQDLFILIAKKPARDRGSYDIVVKAEAEKAINGMRFPPYLPLAQHLKTLKIYKREPSLRDMIYGEQKRTKPDLKPTNNQDLQKCGKCEQVVDDVLRFSLNSERDMKLARHLLQFISYYEMSSIVTIPCVEDAHWVLQVVKAIRVIHPDFEHYCVVSEDSVVVSMIKRHDIKSLKGTRFVLYKPKVHGKLPNADLLFTWAGLEKFNLDEIYQVFKDTVSSEIRYALIGNSPGHPNAKMHKIRRGVFSIVRPEILALNVRAFPFGFDRADRVASVLGKQLLFYNTSRMRDVW